MSLKYYEKLANNLSEIICNSLCVREQRQLNRFSNLEASTVEAKVFKSMCPTLVSKKRG